MTEAAWDTSDFISKLISSVRSPSTQFCPARRRPHKPLNTRPRYPVSWFFIFSQFVHYIRFSLRCSVVCPTDLWKALPLTAGVNVGSSFYSGSPCYVTTPNHLRGLLSGSKQFTPILCPASPVVPPPTSTHSLSNGPPQSIAAPFFPVCIRRRLLGDDDHSLPAQNPYGFKGLVEPPSQGR